MRLVAGQPTLDDREAMLDELDAIGGAHDATILALDARYIVDRTHLERAVGLADRARARGEAIAEDRAMEILCYAAGTRQIQDALALGLSPETAPAIVLVDGGEEAAAAAAVGELIDPSQVVERYDADLVREFFDIGDAELGATDAGIPALVRERVAMLVVER